MTIDPALSVRLATTEADLLAAQRLRYEVFVAELGGDGPLVDHVRRLERDAFDPHYEHLVLVDSRRSVAALDHVVGVYRLMPCQHARRLGRFYSEDEYDLAPLKLSGRRLLELGRSCLHRGYRGGAGLFLLWQGLADYVRDRRVEVLFGVASFHGTDPDALSQPLSYLHHHHLAPPALRVRALPQHFVSMDRLPPQAVDRRTAILQTPSLIKGYLRLGGHVGEGAFVDRVFNTVDVCLVLDTVRMSERQGAIYQRQGAAMA